MDKWKIIENPFMLNTVITNNVKPSAFVDDLKLTWETIFALYNYYAGIIIIIIIMDNKMLSEIVTMIVKIIAQVK